MLKYRPEIDSLRAVAILLVVFFHFNLFGTSGGFIGVDVFFVISGYLITSIIINEINNNKFSFINFYIRRFRRIIPALYLTIILSLFLGYLFFSPEHLIRLFNSTIYSTAALSNNFFFNEGGYFDFNKHFKPLLHTWSLSVELQFYLLWPALIWISYKIFNKKISYIIIIVTLTSLFLSTVYSHRAEQYFYVTFFRLYEFGIGSIVYLIKSKFKTNKNDLIFFVGILILILSGIIYSEESIFPGMNALIPCIGTSLIILTSDKLKYFKNILVNKFLIYIGKISYSIYLVHWPLIIFYKYLALNPLIFLEKILLLFPTLIISIFMYKYIEVPFRKKNK